jgi:hypothetical protein
MPPYVAYFISLYMSSTASKSFFNFAAKASVDCATATVCITLAAGVHALVSKPTGDPKSLPPTSVLCEPVQSNNNTLQSYSLLVT